LKNIYAGKLALGYCPVGYLPERIFARGISRRRFSTFGTFCPKGILFLGYVCHIYKEVFTRVFLPRGYLP
jgi:hypothetical protein